MPQKITTIVDIVLRGKENLYLAEKQLRSLGIYSKQTMAALSGSTAKATKTLQGFGLSSGKINDILANVDRSVARTTTTQTVHATSMRETTKQYNKFGKEVKSVKKNVKGLNRPFQFHYLSIMFFGMAIQRFFQGYARTGADALIKITEGATIQAQAIIGLQAEWRFLTFAIGEAVGEFIRANPWIGELIEKISDFISQNKQLVGTMIAVGLAVGTALFAIGTLKLGLMGFQILFDGFTGFGKTLPLVGKAITSLSLVTKTAVASIGSALTWLLAHPIVLLAAGIVALFVLWDRNIMGIRESTIGLLSPVADFLLGLAQILVTIWRGLQNIGYTIGLSSLSDINKTTDTISLLQKAREALYTTAFKDYFMEGYTPITNMGGFYITVNEAKLAETTDYEEFAKVLGDEVNAQT